MTDCNRKPRRRRSHAYGLSALLVATTLPLAACGPIQFASNSPIIIAGDPPPPPPKPKPKPKPKPSRVEIRDNKIVINEKIQFEFNKADISRVSFSLIEEIAKVIKDNPHIKKISIEGHTSSEGSNRYNKKLSDKRAHAVEKALIDNGVEAERLTAQGFGEERPIADESTDDGKEKNRRVEFLITEQDVTKKKVKIDPETGKETVVEENTEKH